MPELIKKSVLITVRTYPVPSRGNIEASCTAGITDEGQWIRIFPVPYRLMDQDKRFKKWQWIEVKLLKATDGRPESYKIDPDSVVVREDVGPQDGWLARRELIKPLRKSSLCQIQKERDENGHPTLGIFKPFQIKRLLIQPADPPDWTEAQLAILRQNHLFQKAPDRPLEKVPFEFRYEFRCGDVDCNGHTMLCTDWEMLEAYRSWRLAYGDEWEEKFRNRFEKEMIEKFDTHFFVGTVHQHPGSWIIIGLFYPPKQATADLFDR